MITFTQFVSDITFKVVKFREFFMYRKCIFHGSTNSNTELALYIITIMEND